MFSGATRPNFHILNWIFVFLTLSFSGCTQGFTANKPAPNSRTDAFPLQRSQIHRPGVATSSFKKGDKVNYLFKSSFVDLCARGGKQDVIMAEGTICHVTSEAASVSWTALTNTEKEGCTWLKADHSPAWAKKFIGSCESPPEGVAELKTTVPLSELIKLESFSFNK